MSGAYGHDKPNDLSAVDPRPEFVLTDQEKAKARTLVLATCPGDPADVFAMLGVAA